jgi:hypothetical protein
MIEIGKLFEPSDFIHFAFKYDPTGSVSRKTIEVDKVLLITSPGFFDKSLYTLQQVNY